MSYKNYLIENPENVSAYLTKFSGKTVQSTNILWNIYKSYGYKWLIQVRAFELMSEYRLSGSPGLHIHAEAFYLNSKMSDIGLEYNTVPALLRLLYKKGFISGYRYDDSELDIRFTDKDSRYSLVYIGAVPAMKLLLILSNIRDNDGIYIFNEFAALPHIPSDSRYLLKLLRRDILIADAMIICKRKPVFIKCEHSIFPIEGLDGFVSDVRKYGGENAEMLVTVSFLDEDTEFAGKLTEYADKHGIRLVLNIAEYDDDELAEKIKKALI